MSFDCVHGIKCDMDTNGVGVREPVKNNCDRLQKELKGFDKVCLKAGETKQVSITLDADAFKYYDVKKHDRKMDKGVYTILVAASSENIKLQKEICK